MIEIKNLNKIYKTDRGDVVALKNINLTINDGEIFGIIGLSGAGKSTLVRCINMLEVPSEGEILIDGVDITRLKKKDLLKLRQSIGMIFQNFNLMNQKKVLDNVMFPLLIAKWKKEDAKKKAMELLDLVGIGHKANSYPKELSGGEKQRVAIARALSLNPKVILSDEATSALDPNNTQLILELLKSINKKYGITIVVITHEMKVINQICNRVAIIDNSHIEEIGKVEDVFNKPKKEITKEFAKTIIDEDYDFNKIINKKKYRLKFINTLAYEPIVANMILESGVKVSILNADIIETDGVINGSMLISISDDIEQTQKIINYLNKINLDYEEVK